MLMLLLAAAPPAIGQTPGGRFSDNNFHSWFVYSGDHAIRGRWGVHLEGQFRRNGFAVRPQQLLLRPAVNFQITDKVAISAGYGYVSTHRYGENPVLTAFPEHRLHQQITVGHSLGTAWGMAELQHRLRMEERWIGLRTLQPDGVPRAAGRRYQNRLRYMLRVSVPVRKTRWSVVAYDELFLGLPGGQSLRTFDQNRAFGGLGYRFERQTRIEAGYLQQSLLQRSGRVLELNHTIQVGIYTTVPFRKR